MAVQDIVGPGFVGTTTIKWIVTRGLSIGSLFNPNIICVDDETFVLADVSSETYVSADVTGEGLTTADVTNETYYCAD